MIDNQQEPTSISDAPEARAASRQSKEREKALRLREHLFPHVDPDQLWHRRRHKGFTTVPRTLPALINIIDSLTKNQPAGQAYLALWCRAFDESLLTLDNPLSLAAESGFTGDRALSTWRQRMRALEELGFIQSREGSAGQFHYVLLLNPHVIVWKLQKNVTPTLFRHLYERALDIGAEDMSASGEPVDLAVRERKTRKRAGASARKAVRQSDLDG
jgi:hypothetical protein